MKRPQPDLGKIAVDTFIARAGANRKLKRLWGTTTVVVEGQNVEVLNSRRHYHKKIDRPANYKRLFKFLKVYNDVKDYEGEGIKSAWFTLNKSNAITPISVAENYVENNLNRMWWDSNDGARPEGLTLTTTIAIGRNFKTGEGQNLIDLGLDKADLAQAVIDNYDELWLNNAIEQEGVGVINKGSILNEELLIEEPDEDDLSPDDPWLSIISRYALRNSDVPCTIKNVEVGLGRNSARLYNTVVVTLEIPYVLFTGTSPTVLAIKNDMDANNFPVSRRAGKAKVLTGPNTSNENITQSTAKMASFYETADDIDEDTITRQYLQWEDYVSTGSNGYDNYWVKSGDIWYLKADVFDDPKAYGTTHVEFNEYVFSLLDTGFKKEKVPIWKKIVAVIVFIVSVIVTYMSAGTTSGWTAAAYASAYAVIVGALVVTILIALTSALGMNEWAMAFAWLNKEIAPLVTVASIVMVVVAFAQTGAAEALKTYATDAVENFVFEAVLGEFGDLGKIVADALSGDLDGKTLDTINRIAGVYTNVQLQKIENISERNKDVKAEYDKLMEESALDTDIARGYMNIYAKPATADWSIYASTYDLPYERAGGAMSMGNIQRTTKQALRKADYNEPMFESLKLV